MSKELTPLEALEELRGSCVGNCELCSEDFCKQRLHNCDIVETALKRLEQIETPAKKEDIMSVVKRLTALKIIKEKEVDVHLLVDSPNLAHYNRNFDYSDYTRLTRQLTQEEFDLLKEVLL